MQPKTALVLSGGGAVGAYQIGVWKALRESDIRPDIVTGTSVGALNGALITQDDYDTAVSLWESITIEQVFDVETDIDPVAKRYPMLEGIAKSEILAPVAGFALDVVRHRGVDYSRLETLARAHLREEAVRGSDIDFGLVTMEVPSMKPHMLFADDIPDGRILDYLMASAAMFPAAKAKTIDGRDFIDGGYYDNMPIEMAVSRGAERVIAVDLRAFGVNRSYKNKDIELIKVRTRNPSSLIDIVKFGGVHSRRLINEGYLDCLRALGRVDGKGYAFEKNFCGDGKESDRLVFTIRRVRNICEKNAPPPLAALLKYSVAKRIRRYSRVGELTPKAAFIAAAEAAAEVFLLDSDRIYQKDEFDRALSELVESVAIPEGDLWSTISSFDFGGAATMLDKRVIARQLASELPALEAKSAVYFATLGTVIPEAVFAALYLSTAEIG